MESKSQGKGEDRFLKVKRLKALKRTVPDLGLSQQTLAAAKPLLSVKGAVKGSATGRRGGAGSAAAAAAAVAAAAKVSDDEIEGEMVMLNFRKPAKGSGSKQKKKQNEKRGGRGKMWPVGKADHKLQKPKRNAEIERGRTKLPSYRMQEQVMSAVLGSRAVVLTGETGCGKTTQVPQFILEHAINTGEQCFVVCTQPRRVAAVSVAERVAAEWGDAIGATVGYNVRLESKKSEKTHLLFVTGGLLLRMLMGDPTLDAVTHILLDEIHERDRHGDFLLILVRELLRRRDNLRVVLMSATLHSDLFQTYFEEFGCARMHIPGFTFPVDTHYLTQVLQLTGFADHRGGGGGGGGGGGRGTGGGKASQRRGGGDGDGGSSVGGMSAEMAAKLGINLAGEDSDEDEAEGAAGAATLAEYEDALYLAWHAEPDLVAGCSSQLLYFIHSEGVSAAHAHKGTGITALMAAAAKGQTDTCMSLIAAGARVGATAGAAKKRTAVDFARHYGFSETAEAIEAGPEERGGEIQVKEEDLELVDAYQRTFDDDKVDCNLCSKLIQTIDRDDADVTGAVLVFMPGYDDIVKLQQMLEMAGGMHVLPLHSSCTGQEQRQVFKPPPTGKRKVVLATNIAETSLTINDVVYVIDTGRVKEKTYDESTGVGALTSVWVSKASARQRRGRAGRVRPGTCFHLFSQRRRAGLDEYQTPELLRTPLAELCLHARMLCLDSMTIEQFLEKAPDPPRARAVAHAIDILQKVGGLDKSCDVTPLGYQLASLSLEPQLAKMVLVGLCLGCLEPVLCLAATRSHRSPFMMPMDPTKKQRAKECHKRFSRGADSDHASVVNAVAEFRAAHSKYQFCNANFISHAGMQTISGIMFQLKGQLQQIGLLPRHDHGGGGGPSGGGGEGGGGSSGGGGPMAALHRVDPNRNSGNWALVQAAVVAGLYPNVAHSSPGSQQFLSHDNLKARISTRSLVKPADPQDGRIRWVVFDEVSRGAMNTDLRDVSVVSPITIFLVAGLCLDIEPYTPPPIYDEETGDELPQNDSYTVALDGWCKARMQPESAKAIVELRKCWGDIFEDVICGTNCRSGGAGVWVVGLDGIAKVLTVEAMGVDGVSKVEMQKLSAAGRGRGGGGRQGRGRGGGGRGYSRGGYSRAGGRGGRGRGRK